MNEHLVILQPRYLNLIITGKKDVECRASRFKRVPYLRVCRGDQLWFKRTSGCVTCTSRVVWVKELHITERQQFDELRARWQDRIRADDSFWRAAHLKRYWTLLGLGRVRRCKPFAVRKRDRRGWVVLNSSEQWWPADRLERPSR
ncbi:MAG: hypothetical protein IIA66_14440 [Planctomycetes bacterium]|nr:hypothetical protein [Planctomycetota bacterium]